VKYDHPVQCAAAVALAKLNDIRSVPALLRFLDTAGSSFDSRALVEFDDPRIVLNLLDHYAKSDQTSRHVLATAINSIMKKQSAGLTEAVLRRIAELADAKVVISICDNSYDREIDFHETRQIARQELIRRGLRA
jgi:HEAT repeat protein